MLRFPKPMLAALAAALFVSASIVGVACGGGEEKATPKATAVASPKASPKATAAASPKATAAASPKASPTATPKASPTATPRS